MKKYIPILLATSLLLSACSIDSDTKKTKIFEKQLECQKITDSLIKWESKYSIDDKDMYQNSEIETVFYSPENNTCMYAGRITTVYKNIADPKNSKNSVTLYINNALSFDDIYTSKIGEY